MSDCVSMEATTLKATLALADGRIFRGTAFGAEGKTGGEVVFNTSMTGYQEILTDPSYDGQIVVMTYPEIGNVGVNCDDVEATRPYVQGFVVKEYWDRPSNYRAETSLGAYMKQHGIVGIEGIDTRALVRHIRDHGAQQAVLATGEVDEQALVAEAAARPSLVGQDLATRVTTPTYYRWTGSTWTLDKRYSRAADDGPLVAAFDYGLKLNIARCLAAHGCRVVVVPAGTSAEEIRALGADGLFLSNGPGDPDAVQGAVEVVQDLARDTPTFGICLGHQILALALGGKTYKMKFGHHGGNQPVLDIDSGVVSITAQNHGFAVDPQSLPPDVRITHLNLNDNTVEGLAHKTLPVFSVQYHPEASPGPHDAAPLFEKFVEMMKQHRKDTGRASRVHEFEARDDQTIQKVG
ncbi:MAG TPA: glutamine-hydrolyzing carbamoyl-phosphate synthase small subunit [Candidatus Limnocylindrales bacterium]|nr:glutamine-hydrolyzing carbamoyl-phosphate synthase small subunit [Candidatus Limnocylindrales bacterium]